MRNLCARLSVRPAWVVDEPLQSAWLTERAVPVALFRNVAGQWQRAAIEHTDLPAEAVASVADDTGPDPALLRRELDAQLDQAQLDAVRLNLYVRTAAAVISVLSVGYLVWTLQGDHLLASLLARLPARRKRDLLGVLESADANKNSRRDDDDNRGDELTARSRPREPSALE
jgi:hypothetical protein